MTSKYPCFRYYTVSPVIRIQVVKNLAQNNGTNKADVEER